MRRLTRLIGLGYLAICLATLAATAVVGPLGYAPFALPLGPARTPVAVTIWYGTEKEEWLTEAAARYTASAPTINGRPIQIELKGLGSREMVDRVAQQQWGNDTPPTVISPASSLWVELLKSDWQTRNGTAIVGTGADATQPLVLTPLVLVAWEDRAKVLWPNGPASIWGDLHSALADPQGWSSRGKPEWGFVKFGHTSPLTSNSGAQTLLLLSYGYYGKTSKLSTADILNSDFQKWLVEVEQGVTEFGDSTGTFMTDMVRYGPSKYDIVAVYENLAIQDIEQAQGRWKQNIRLYYPPATLLSDHPYVPLQAPWVTPEQRSAAEQFRAFLLSRPIQELALQYGFRPADPSVAIVSSDPNNPFNKYASYGVQVDIAQQVEVPPADVLNTLLDLWRRQVNR